MHKIFSNKHSGFTIVELLVVIVVIGILAAITITSYSGISKQAVVASLKSDLVNASSQLKMYNILYGEYPSALDASNCPSLPTADTKYCFKLSGDNIRESYDRPTPQTFVLIIRNGSSVYQITNDSAPMIPPIFALGGTIVEANGVRTHTFTACTLALPCDITANLGGTVSVSVLGAGGGGGVGSACCGGDLTGDSGGNSSVQHIINNATYIANGGGGGGPGYDPGDSCTGGSDGVAGGYQGLGSADLTSWTKVTSGGSPGGAGGGGCAPGGIGGFGGRLTGYLTVSAGHQLRIIVGVGGAGGYEAGNGIGGSVGSPGSVVISY